MSSGHSAHQAYTISTEQVYGVVGSSLTFKFVTSLGTSDLEDYAEQRVHFSDEFGPETHDAYYRMIDKFLQETGLTLELCYHNTHDEGSRYDDVDGSFWAVGNVMLPTLEAKLFESKHGSIQLSGYVKYG